MITKMHISRGEARTPTANSHEPQLAQGANGRREEHELIACFDCDLLSFFVRLPILQLEWGCATGRLSTAHARASSVPDHAKGTVFLPLGAQTGSSV